MPNLSVRGIDAATVVALKTRAERDKVSVNAVVVRLIGQGLGRATPKSARRRHDDLDALAGSWTPADGKEFDDATAPFERVDADLWK